MTLVFTITTDTQWIVPRGNPSVTVRLWGEDGEDGSAEEDPDSDRSKQSGGNGGDGAYVEGELPVSEGDVLNINIGHGGGSGGNLSYYDISADAGNGGGYTDIRMNGDTIDDRVAVAGGGGGGGAAASSRDSDGDSILTDGENGGDSNEDGDDVGSNHYSPGEVGGSSDETGVDGDTRTMRGDTSDDDFLDSEFAAAGGGGGGGATGGGGSGVSTSDVYDHCLAGGGAGGTSDASGLTGATIEEGGADGVTKVEIEYREPIEDLSATATDEPSIELDWSDRTWEDGYTVIFGETTTMDEWSWDIPQDSDSYTIPEMSENDERILEDGENFFVAVEAYDDTVTSRSNQDGIITPLPEPSITTVEETDDGDIRIEWFKEDDSTDGEWVLFRSTDESSLGTRIFDTNDLSRSEYVDSGDPNVGDSETVYYYTLRRESEHTHSSTSVEAVMNMSAPTDLLTTVTEDDATFTWTDNSSVEGGYRVELSRDGGTTWSDESGDLPSDTESYTATDLLDGERYHVRIMAFRGRVEVRDIGGGGGSPGDGEDAVTVEGWESESFDAWSPGADMDGSSAGDSYQINDSVPWIGNACLQTDHASNQELITSHPDDGLPEYIGYGTTSRWYFRSNENNNGGASMCFAVGSGDETFFQAQMGFTGDVIHLRKITDWSAGSNEWEEQADALFYADTWYRGELTWDNGELGGNPGDITYTVYEASSDEQLAQIQTNDADWTDREAIGVSLWSTAESHHIYHDHLEIAEVGVVPTTVVDDFESDLTPYQTGGSDMSRYNVVDASTVSVDAISGSQIMEIGSDSGATERIWSLPDDGLDNYPSKGSLWDFHLYIPDTATDNDFRHAFGFADTSTYYDLTIDTSPTDPALYLNNAGSAGYAALDTDASGFSLGEWKRVEIRWDDGTWNTEDEITVNVYDDGASSPASSVTATNSEHAGNAGIFWRGYQNGNDLYVDNAVIQEQ